MSSGQKVIKYFALALGIALSISIVYILIKSLLYISSNASSIENLFHIEVLNDDKYIEKFSNNIEEYYDDIKTININCNVAKLNIKSGDKLKVEAKNVTDEFFIELSENKVLNIDDNLDEDNVRINKGKIPEITIYVTDKEFDSIKINTGISNSNIVDVTTKKLELELGVGNVDLKNINVKDIVEIEAGTGNLTINDSIFTNLDLEAGVGNIYFYSSNILGNSKIDCGVGNLNLNITNNSSYYTLDIIKGLGNVIIDGKKINSKITNYSDGPNKISIEGGMGNIKINFNY